VSLKDDVFVCQACPRHRAAVSRKLGFGPKDFNLLIVVDRPTIADGGFLTKEDSEVLSWLFEQTHFDDKYKIAYTSLVKCSGDVVTGEQISSCVRFLKNQCDEWTHSFAVVVFSVAVTDGLEGCFFKNFFGGHYFALFKNLGSYDGTRLKLLEKFNAIF